MDNNESWATLIKSTLENVKNGISKGTWEYEYKIDNDEHTDWRDWEGKAINHSYTVEIWLTESGQDVGEYSFVIINGEKVFFQVIGTPSHWDAPSRMIINYLKLLKNTQEDFRAEAALKIVDELPE